MTKNVGTTDRVIRTILGLVIIYFAYASFSGFWAFVGYVIGAVLLFTAFTGSCYLYSVMGKSTLEEEKKM